MLSTNEINALTDIFQKTYKKQTDMQLLESQAEIHKFLHEENRVIRALAFNNNNWKFREEMKLKQRIVDKEIRNR